MWDEIEDDLRDAVGMVGRLAQESADMVQAARRAGEPDPKGMDQLATFLWRHGVGGNDATLIGALVIAAAIRRGDAKI